MDECDTVGPLEELYTPIEGGIAAADDDDLLIAKRLGVGDDVVDPTTVPRLGAGLREPAR